MGKKEKLEELDDDDLLNLRKELLKQMKAEDLEKLEAGEGNIEDGEISDSGEEEVDKPPKSASLDTRARLRRNTVGVTKKIQRKHSSQRKTDDLLKESLKMRR